MRLLFLFLMFFSGIAFAGEVSITWTAPTEREDGTLIESPVSFRLYHTLNNIEQETIELESGVTNYNLSEASTGTHTFQISAIESGLEGELSAPASKQVNGSKPGRVIITIDCRGCN